MTGIGFIFADLLIALGRDPYHAQVTEIFFIVFALAPVVAGAPLLLVQWDKYRREEKARRSAARRRIARRIGGAAK